MGVAAPLGVAVTVARVWRGWVVVAIVLVAGDQPAAQDRFTLIVSGATGDQMYAERYDAWRATLVQALRSQPDFRDEHLIVLAETPGAGVGRASREGVRQAIGTLRDRMTADSELYIILIGHGSYDGVDAKFNLVGPDLEAAEWDAVLGALPGQVVVVITTNASFPFMSRLAREGRVVITATDSPVQRYDTVFPQFFVEALSDPAADVNKNGRVSLLEAFEFAGAQVRRWYERQGLLATERPVLDDTGDGLGKEAGQPGPDGAIAARLYPGAGVQPAAVVADSALAPLIARRDELEDQIEALKAQKPVIHPDLYAGQLERLLVELAQVSREIRKKVGGS